MKIQTAQRSYALSLTFLLGAFALLMLAHSSLSQAEYQVVAQQNPVLAPSQDPIEASELTVTANEFSFPAMLPDSGLPLTAGSLFASVVTAGINPVLIALLIVVIALGYWHHRKITQPDQKQ